jgi:P27 family predicted phage terminase small subunit
MGRRGPLAKPDGHAQGHRRRVPLELVAAAVVPEPPTGLLAVTRASWEVFWRSEVAGATTAVDLPAVRRLFGFYDQFERAQRAARKSLLIAGSKGQMRLNPLADYALKLDATILRLENELGLTPMSRARLGLTIGAMQRTLEELNERFRESDDDVVEVVDPRVAAGD